MKFIRHFWPALAWFILSFVLLTLPGSSLPSNDWLSGIGFDKYVHIGLFGILVFLFCWGTWKRFPADSRNTRRIISTGMLALAYGIAMEFVQRDFIPNRSFDVGDILADGMGALLGVVFSWWRFVRRTGVA